MTGRRPTKASRRLRPGTRRRLHRPWQGLTASGITTASSCSRRCQSDDGRQGAIECELAYGPVTETWLFWWDAATKQIKSPNLDSGGSWSEKPISKQGSECFGQVNIT